jgi:hypothetical protein
MSIFQHLNFGSHLFLKINKIYGTLYQDMCFEDFAAPDFYFHVTVYIGSAVNLIKQSDFSKSTIACSVFREILGDFSPISMCRLACHSESVKGCLECCPIRHDAPHFFHRRCGDRFERHRHATKQPIHSSVPFVLLSLLVCCVHF